MSKPALLGVLVLAASALAASSPVPPGLSALRETDLRSDLATLADAHFQGRSAGTLDELKAAAWLAERYRAIGLRPMGEDGTYFQFFTLWRNELGGPSTIRVNDRPLALWQDAIVAQLADVSLDGPIVFLPDIGTRDLSKEDVKGKIVAFVADPKNSDTTRSLPTWRYPRSILTNYALPLLLRGAAAIVVVADPVGEAGWADAAENYKRGLYDLKGRPGATVTATAPVIWLHASARAELEAHPARLQARLVVDKHPYPSVNVIGAIAGTDPARRDEYVLYSGHTDAHGVRNPIRGDTVYHGADDNGSVDVAMLATARAFVQAPARRSVLFVIHGAEERGLLGSTHFTAHPTVPIGSIVAVLNGDMIGRNATGSAALLGVTPPHLNSAALVAMARAANDEGPRFALDASWDEAKHPEIWYFRSDHVPYARLGIPAIMYSSLLHPDYHTPQDNAESINYPKLLKMTEWMYRTGWKVANADARPAVEKDFKLER